MKRLKLLRYDILPSLKEQRGTSKQEKSLPNSADNRVNCVGKLAVSSRIFLQPLPVEFAGVQVILPSARKKLPYLLTRL